MRKVSYIKFRLLRIFAIFLFSTSIVGCSSTKDVFLNNASQKKSISVQLTESTVITFADKNLEEIVREKIQCHTGDILQDDVDKITDLGNTEGKHITNLSGIENLTNLTLLNLSNNQISNIEPLKGLTNLTNLNLASNQMSNLEPLKGLTKLISLNLNTNQISNIESLKGLTRLTELNLDTNKMSNIEPLKGLTKLTDLNLASNQMSNIEPLKKLTNLTDLNLASNQMSNIGPLMGLTKLTDLNLDTNNIKDFSPVSNYGKNAEKTDAVSIDIVSIIIALKSKTLSVSNQVVERSVSTFQNRNLEKTINGGKQGPTEDILKKDILKQDVLKEDADKISNPQNAQDNPIVDLSGNGNGNDLKPGAEEVSNVEPLK